MSREPNDAGPQNESGAPSTLDPLAFRAIAEFTYDWESWVGADGRLMWVNTAVERIAGYSVEECLGMHDYPLPLVHADDRELLTEISVSARAGNSANHVEFRILGKNGALRWGAISYQPLFDREGKRLGYRSSVRDIDERKQMEARLRALVIEAQQASRAKTEFLANVSHELRTPLQSLVSHAELLERAPISDEHRGYASTMVHEGRHLERLVLDLLDYAALSAGELAIVGSCYSPREQFASRLRTLGHTAAGKGLDFQVHLPEREVLVEGDADRALQILTNLVKNAVDYTREGQVEVLVSIQERTMTIAVADSGPGLPAGLNLFEPFRRGESAGTSPGFGLGLAITARLAARLGGVLRVDRPPSGGTRMVAEFEVQPCSVARTPAESRDLNLPVLVVDDVASVREALVTTIHSLGRAAMGAADGERAVEFLRVCPGALVLLDLNIPGSQALSNARKLRQHLGPSGRLWAMSASFIGSSQKELEAAGFDGFLLKPIRLEQLEALFHGGLSAQFATFQKRTSESRWDLGRLRELEATRDAEGRSLLVRLLKQFEVELPRLLAELEVSRFESEQPRETGSQAPRSQERALHDLAGVAGLVGATTAYDFFVAAETKCREGDDVSLVEVSRVASQFLDEFRRRVG